MRLPLTNVRWWAAISLLILSLNAISDTNDMQMVGDTVVFRHDRNGQEYTITVMNPVVWQGDKAVFMACHKKVAYALLSRAHRLILRAVNQVNSDNILGLEYVVTEINPNDDKVDLSYWTSIGLRRQGQLPINELDKGRLYTKICVSTASVSEVIASLSSDEDWQAPVVEKKISRR